MIKKGCWVMLVVLLLGGCLKQGWLALIHMARAEKAYAKAYTLRVQREAAYKKRLELYQEACGQFLKAADYDANLFTLNRIEMAAQACMRAGDKAGEERFGLFAELYAQRHPQEAEHGDQAPIFGIE